MRTVSLGRPIAALLACYMSMSVASAASDFRTWYPEYGPVLQGILETTCSAEYDVWSQGNRATADYANGTSTTGEAVVQCLLSSASEFMKVDFTPFLPLFFPHLYTNYLRRPTWRPELFYLA